MGEPGTRLTTYMRGRNNPYLAVLIIGFGIITTGWKEVDKKIQSGNKLFHTHCASCHGKKGVGQDPKQPMGGWDEKDRPIAPALDGTAHAWHHAPQVLFGYMKKGSVDKESPMPLFKDILTEEEMVNIIRYIQSLWPPETVKGYRESFKKELEEFKCDPPLLAVEN